MSRFLQLHLLTAYPPSNLNRDDLGRPKTAVFGGVPRLRISSQSLKRAWRTSEVFESALKGHVGTRTKEMGRQVYRSLMEGGTPDGKARDWAKKIAGQFGATKKAKKDDPMHELEIEQLAHFSPVEITAIETLATTLANEQRDPSDEELQLLRKEHQAADIALFGRMLASSPQFNAEAACQVAHAITINKVQVEDDFFTAVDDLNAGDEDLGAGHMGEVEFGAGVFYLYLCIDLALLADQLGEGSDLLKQTLRALTECAATVAPTGKQNSFASRAYSSYILAEKGERQPRSLAVSFIKPIHGPDQEGEAIGRLEHARDSMDKVYGPCADARYTLSVSAGKGSLQELLDFVSE